VKAEYTREVLIAFTVRFGLRYFLEVQYARVELDGAIEV
jgi:hypothetical protein